jgi:hypothetical protein
VLLVDVELAHSAARREYAAKVEVYGVLGQEDQRNDQESNEG